MRKKTADSVLRAQQRLCRSVLTGKDSERTARTEKVPQDRLLLLRNDVNGQFVRCIVKECIDASMGRRVGGRLYCRDVREGTPKSMFSMFFCFGPNDWGQPRFLA